MTKHKKICFSLAYILLILLLGELFCRAYSVWYRKYHIQDHLLHPVFRDYFFLGRAYKPNSVVKLKGLPPLDINRYGFPGQDFSLEKSNDIYRIITMGGSTTYSGGYPEKLEALLNQNTKTNKYEVINCAVPSWNTTQSLINYIIRGAYLEPDLIIIYHAINNVNQRKFQWFYNLPEVDYEKYSGFLSRNSYLYHYLKYIYENLRMRIGILFWKQKMYESEITTERDNEQGDKDYLHTFNADIKHLILLAKENNSKVLLVTMPLNYDPLASAENNAARAGLAYENFEFLYNRVSRINGSLRRVGENFQGVAVLDLAKTTFFKKPTHFRDLCHFSEAGALAFANELSDFITTMNETVKNQR